VNDAIVLRVEYDSAGHADRVYDGQRTELLRLHYDSAGRIARITPHGAHLDPLSVTYDRQGRQFVGYKS